MKFAQIHDVSLISIFFSDIDECSLGSDNCDVNAQCINEMGTFSCECNAGFTGDGVTCIGKITRITMLHVFF